MAQAPLSRVRERVSRTRLAERQSLDRDDRSRLDDLLNQREHSSADRLPPGDRAPQDAAMTPAPLSSLIPLALAAACANMAFAPTVQAGADVTIYRCTDAKGRLTLRDSPCNRGDRQETRSMLRPKDAPQPPPRPPLAPIDAAPAAAPQIVVVNAPRPLYECVTPDQERYLSDTPEGNPRWVPLWTQGYPVLARVPVYEPGRWDVRVDDGRVSGGYRSGGVGSVAVPTWAGQGAGRKSKSAHACATAATTCAAATRSLNPPSAPSSDAKSATSMPVSHRIVADMLPNRTAVFACALLAATVHAPARAQTDITIYRCVDPSGAVSLQNDTPCPKGSQQTVRKVGVLPTLPAPPAALKPVAPKPATAAIAPAPAPAPAAPIVRTPPPPLFQCRTWDERDYFGDTAEPPATCVPVQALGIDGTVDLAAGSTCEMRQDACAPIAAEQLCTTWKKRMDEAEFRWKVGGGRDDDRKADYDRWAKIYRDSSCVGG
jgi:hypothetical protein